MIITMITYVVSSDEKEFRIYTYKFGCLMDVNKLPTGLLTLNTDRLCRISLNIYIFFLSDCRSISNNNNNNHISEERHISSTCVCVCDSSDTRHNISFDPHRFSFPMSLLLYHLSENRYSHTYNIFIIIYILVLYTIIICASHPI